LYRTLQMSDNQRLHIIHAAIEKMRQVGIRSVSIDDVCRTLGMSKKTFYVYFTTKDELVEAALRHLEEEVSATITAKLEQKSVLEQLLNFQKVVRSTRDVRKIPPLIYDLEKYYPLLYQQHCARRKENTLHFVQRGLTKGKEERLFREDLDIEKTSTIITSFHDMVMNLPSLVREDKKTMEYVRYASDIIIRGIVSDEGKQMIDNYLKNKQ